MFDPIKLQGIRAARNECKPSPLHRFDPGAVIIDPYAKALSGPSHWRGASRAQARAADWRGLVTDDHFDHLDPMAVQTILKPDTAVVGSRSCAGKLPKAIILANGDTRTVLGLAIEAVPAYNIVNKRPGDGPFHPKGDGNGYIVTFGDKRVYIAGDTENTPEMKALKAIDVAFLPMNLPYTMTPEMVADAARAIRPKILYPYHFGDTDTSRLVKLLQGEKGIEVRIRKLS